jgi:tetratricopeptide (TPR) repeat protein
MMTPSATPAEPPALRALRAYPLLLSLVETSMLRQSARIMTREQHFWGQQTALAELEHVLQTLEGGLVALEGPPGSGVTALLSHLAATRQVAFWFSEDDARQGATALAAQLVALHQRSVPLIPPAIQNAPTTLERFLAEIASQSPANTPLIVVIDPPACPLQPHTPIPVLLPGTIPPNVLIVYGCTPESTLPFMPAARVVLPQQSETLQQEQAHLLHTLGCPAEWITPIIAAAQGNMLYVRLACGLLQAGIPGPQDMHPGLDTLYAAWWSSLDTQGQRLALLLAAAGEALPQQLCTAFAGTATPAMLAAWQQIGLVTIADHTVQFAHWSVRDYLARSQGAALEQAHSDIAALALTALDMPNPISTQPAPALSAARTPDATAYLLRQFSRHAALGTGEAQKAALPLVSQRDWVRMQERQAGHMADAAHDMAWELHVAAALGPLVRLVRSTALASTLVSLSRTLSPDAAVEALHAAAQQSGREGGLRQVRAMVDQLPDVQAKALILRRLGEACYGLHMRTMAMRLLSQALDIEEQKQPAAWREQREQLHNVLVQAALDLGDSAGALKIGVRIQHAERRGMAETRVVRWLLAQNDLQQAQTIAEHIEHDSLREWAQAEVVVALARAGNIAAAEALLAELQSETASSWASIELACDEAAQNEDAARQRIDRLGNPNQRDRGLARLARALALADKDGDALDAAAQIGDTAVRVSALLDLRLTLEGLVAMLALDQATSIIGKLPNEVRVPLVSMLAAAYASLGHPDEALKVAGQLASGEEHDRALSRVAVALAQHGSYEQALSIARGLADDDERDWALDELARVFAAAGYWQEAQQLADEISAEHQQARTLADLAIARARAGEPMIALQMANHITSMQSEFARAATLIAPLLVQIDRADIALALVQDQQYLAHLCVPAHTLLPPQVSRYLGTVVAALAEHGSLAQARDLIQHIQRPLDRARARIALAQAAADAHHDVAVAELGLALRAALLGRDEALRLLEQAVPLLAALGGAALMQEAAAAIDEVDNL